MAGKSRIPKEYLGATRWGHRRGVQEYIDDDLAFELSRKAALGDKSAKDALEFLTRFNNEYYRGVVRKDDSAALHNTPRLYKAANDAHNARRRDILSVARSGRLGPTETILTSTDEHPETLDSARNISLEISLSEDFYHY